ncbi:hypothetical protein TSMEX_007443 [Taenia solium]|eukprot:TsM_000382200 transcript=TsM_000382200 gene=TsM_000382200
MTSEKLAEVVGDKITLLTSCDESAIKQAELVYAKRNAQLKREIDALKEKLDNLETMAGYNQFFSSSFLNFTKNPGSTSMLPSIRPTKKPGGINPALNFNVPDAPLI